MNKFGCFLICFVCFCCFLSAGPALRAQANESEPEIEALIEEAAADNQKGAIFSYTYTMKFSYTKNGKFGLGRKFTRVYEAILPTKAAVKRKFSHPLVLLKDSERMVTDEEIMAMRKKLGEELEKLETEAAAEQNLAETESKNGGYWTIRFSSNGRAIGIDVLKLLKNSDFTSPQRASLNNRSLVVINFSPRENAAFDSAVAYLSKLEGRIWIDEADKRIIRIEAFPVGKLAEMSILPETERDKNAVFLYHQTRVAEGFWFPKQVVFNFTRNPDIFEPVRIEFSFADYNRSSVEIQSSDVEAPPEAEAEENRP